MNNKTKSNYTSETDDDLAFTIELAKEGDVYSQKQLAEMYREGNKIPKNDVKAFQWSLKAASQGEPDSIFDVGLSYLQGYGINQDKKEAMQWLSRLAFPETSEATTSHQMAQAQLWMAVAYYSPGEPRDISIAYGWLLLSICYSQPWEIRETPYNSDIIDSLRNQFEPLIESQRATLEKLERVKAKYESEMTPEERASGQKMAEELFRPIKEDDEDEE